MAEFRFYSRYFDEMTRQAKEAERE